MSFGQAVKTALHKFATFDGRARRSEFWWFYLAMQIVAVVLILIPYVLFFVALISSSANSSTGDTTLSGFAWAALALMIVGCIATLVLAIPVYAAMARRLHDTGQTGHWVWLSFAGLGIVPLIMCAMEGNAYANQYGPDPKAGEHPYGGFPPQGYAQPAYPAAQPTYAAAPPSYPTAPSAYPTAPSAYPTAPGGYAAPPAPLGYPAPPAPPVDPFGGPTA